jgi:hypothetical protein
MSTDDDILYHGRTNHSELGTPLGLIYQQLKIITLILKEIANITDDDFTLLGKGTPTLNPPIPPNPNFTEPL